VPQPAGRVQVPAVAAAGLPVLVLPLPLPLAEDVPDELHAARTAAAAATASTASSTRRRATPPLSHCVAVAAVENLPCCHDFLSFVPGLCFSRIIGIQRPNSCFLDARECGRGLSCVK
jgi:hypothetical protein